VGAVRLTFSSLCNDFREMARKTGHRAAQPTSPEPEQSTITAGDIVQKLMRITRRGNTGTLMERVRSWTKEKFLVPLEGLGQGPGKHARYHPSVIYLAALLNTFAERGLQISQQRKLFEAYVMFEPLKSWTVAKKRDVTSNLVLVISQFEGDQVSIKIQSDYRQEISIDFPDDDFWAVLDLGRIWTKLERAT
jgi:hypothetical protein